MLDMNVFTCTGRLGKEPTEIAGGGIRFPVAVDDSYKNKTTGEYVDRTYWMDVVVFQAEYAKALLGQLKTGGRVAVQGKIAITTSEKGGDKKYYTSVVANQVLSLAVKEKKAETTTTEEDF